MRAISASTFLASWLACGVSSATLIERDWLAPGDGLLTFDPRTGLEWLDISQTQLENFSPGLLVEDRYQAVLAETLPSGKFDGFSVATEAQARDLAFSVGAVFGTSNYDLNGSPTEELLSLLGPTIVIRTGEHFRGILSDATSTSPSRRSVFAILRDFETQPARSAAVALMDYRMSTQAYPDPDTPGIGVMLVRPVPEPTTLALACASLGVATRRRAVGNGGVPSPAVLA